MARFLNEYKEIDTRPTWEKVATITTLFILFLLVPTTVLGYYSESSLPGQPLYPLKRGIESMVLLVETFAPYKKSLYYQTLATKRVNETATLVAQAETNGDLSASDVAAGYISLTEVVTTVQQAAKETNAITDPAQKKQAQLQLASSIKAYQSQLTQMNYTIEQHLITPTPTPQQQAATADNSTPTPTPSDTTTTTNLQDQISQTQQDLQSINQDLQNLASDSSSFAPTLPPTPTVTPPPPPHHGGDGGFHFFYNQRH